MEEKRGTIFIAEDVLAALAQHAARRVAGLAALDRTRRPGAGAIFAGRHRSVAVEPAGEGVRFALHVVLRHGRPLHQVAADVQREVIREVETLTQLRVLAVDVFVEEVLFGEPSPPPPAPGSGWEGRITAALAEHPAGLTLTQLGDVLGVNWRRLIAPATSMVRRGELRKQDKTYLLPESAS
ncbi:MAG: Asp23/Gls24 family envelope stress response protein [Candidatus Bipolaricaulaceae bacterium]